MSNGHVDGSGNPQQPQQQPPQPQQQPQPHPQPPTEPAMARVVGPAVVERAPARPRWTFFGCVGMLFVVLFMLTSCGLNVFLASLVLGTTTFDDGVITTRGLHEKLLQGDEGAKDKILVIDIKGPIMSGTESFLFASSGDVVEDTIDALKRAEKDDKVRAIIFHVDSPGGSITACEQINNQTMRFREKRKDVPIIAFMGSIAASGGYYVSAPCDLIMCHRTTITGSIGVIMQLLNYEGLFEKIGLRGETIKSADKKDIGSGLRPMTEEERQLFHKMIMEMYDRFVEVVDAGRKNLDREAILKLADGSVFTGKQALENGLVDKLGFFDDAVEEAKRLGRIGKARVIQYRRPPSLFDLLMAAGAQRRQPDAGSIALDLKRLIDERTPRFMYLWTVD
ncbi:MAG: signal peptide peptidase SppA [Planctomycetota bacterium]|nr:signal peptide peptidase SppA [Planctomycetota bacterium]